MVRRGFDLVEGGSPASDLVDDLFGGFVPDERFRVVVPVFGPGLDGLFEFVDAGEHASAESTIGEFFEPALDQVEPRRAGGDEVQVPASPSRVIQPVGDLGSHVG